MKLFNAFQLVVLFAIWPYIVNWLHGGPFAYSFAVFVLSIILWIIGFIWFVCMVWENFSKD